MSILGTTSCRTRTRAPCVLWVFAQGMPCYTVITFVCVCVLCAPRKYRVCFVCSLWMCARCVIFTCAPSEQRPRVRPPNLYLSTYSICGQQTRKTASPRTITLPSSRHITHRASGRLTLPAPRTRSLLLHIATLPRRPPCALLVAQYSHTHIYTRIHRKRCRDSIERRGGVYRADRKRGVGIYYMRVRV